jgi:hypothetical protein
VAKSDCDFTTSKLEEESALTFAKVKIWKLVGTHLRHRIQTD